MSFAQATGGDGGSDSGDGDGGGGGPAEATNVGVPFWCPVSMTPAPDPKNTPAQTAALTKGEKYFEEWKVKPLIEALASALLYECPPNPYLFLQQVMHKTLTVDAAGSRGASGEGDGREWHAFVSQKKLRQVYRLGDGSQTIPKKPRRSRPPPVQKGSAMRELDTEGERGAKGKAAMKARAERIRRIKEAKARAPRGTKTAISVPTKSKVMSSKPVLGGIPKGKKKKKKKKPSVDLDAEPPTPDEAATTIQAAFKGYSVRKKIGGAIAKRMPSHHTKEGKLLTKSARPGARGSDEGGLTRNQGFIFLKPHADTKQVRSVVKDTLAKFGLTVVNKGRISGGDIAAKNIVRKHYPYYSKFALDATADDVAGLIDNELFSGRFGETWEEALGRGAVKNAVQAMADLSIDAGDLLSLFKDAEEVKGVHKFGLGIILAKITPEGQDPCYVLNAFFPKMMETYHHSAANVYYYVIEWESTDLTWSGFLEDVVGATNPEKAREGSIRRLVKVQWDELGLLEMPDTMDNVMHAAHSPLGSVANQCNWLGLSAGATSFGRALHAGNVPKAQVVAWLESHEAGDKANDLVPKVDGIDCQACFDKCMSVLEAG